VALAIVLLVAVAIMLLVAVPIGEVEVAAGGVSVPWQATQIPKRVIKENKEIFFHVASFQQSSGGR
jgi:hypothetical protein